MVPPSRRTILVIDDDPAIRKVLSLGLERQGFSIRLATNGQEGLDILASGTIDPDCILLDIRMPVLSGKEALPKIRELLPFTPVIMLTAYNDLATGLEAMKNGAYDYITKPFEINDLRARVTSVLRRNRLGQSGLWGHGISGDLPIVLLRIGEVGRHRAALSVRTVARLTRRRANEAVEQAVAEGQFLRGDRGRIERRGINGRHGGAGGCGVAGLLRAAAAGGDREDCGNGKANRMAHWDS